MNEWKTVRLGDVFNLQMGKTPDRKNLDFFSTTDNKWISIADISKADKYIIETKEYISDEAVKKSGIKQIPANTVIMSFKLSIGKTAITKEPMYSNEAIMAFLPNGKYEVDNDFLYHLFSNKDWSEGSNKAVKGITLNKASLLEAKILLPPLAIQKQIAKIMDKCTEVISKNERMLENYDSLIKSRFIEMFGDIIQNTKNWELKSFTEIAKSRLGKMLDTKKQTGKEKYPYLANFNVQWFRFNLENLNEMDFSEADRIEFALKDGDLLVCEGGEVGRCAVWHNQIKNCFFQKAVHRVRLNMDLVHPDYMAYWFKFRSDFNSFDNIVGSKATIAHLTGEKLKLLQIPVPPLSLQNNFASFVQQIDKSKFAVQKSLEKAEILYKSLMQEYFG